MQEPEWDRMPQKAKQKYIEVLRRIPIGRRLEITAELSQAVRDLMAAGIRAKKPDITDEELRKEIIRRTLPADLVKKAYGW
ncbi:MAG: hypothetical protein ABFD64_12825 [Armatimonadota bacterium]